MQPAKLAHQLVPHVEALTVHTLSHNQGGHKRNVFDINSDDKQDNTSSRAKMRRKRDNVDLPLTSKPDTLKDCRDLTPAKSTDQHFRRTDMLLSLSLPSTINGVASQTQSVLGTSSNTSHRRTHGHHVMFRSQNSIQTRNFEKMCARGHLCLGAEGHQELTIDHNDHRQYCSVCTLTAIEHEDTLRHANWDTVCHGDDSVVRGWRHGGAGYGMCDSQTHNQTSSNAQYEKHVRRIAKSRRGSRLQCTWHPQDRKPC